MKYKPYYKKVDITVLGWGVTIPNEYVKDFEAGLHVRLGTHRNVEIIWGKKKYSAKLCNKRHRQESCYQLLWDTDKNLLNELRKKFIQSYVILKSQKELLEKSKNGKKQLIKLPGGQQEVLILKPISSRQIEIKPFIRIVNDWNTLFERLSDANVFGLLFDKDEKYLILKSTDWFKVEDFGKHANATNVIYYLVYTKGNLLYIGEAKTLGKRVTPGKKHQEMPADWDKFRYDVIKPEYSNLRKSIEDHTIRTFASILKNRENYSSLELSSYTLVNSRWKKL